MVLGHAAALLLGLVAAVITILVGPALQLLVRQNSGMKTAIPWSDLLSERLSSFPVYLTGSDTVDASILFSTLPWILIAVALVKALLGGIQWFIWERIGERIARRIRHDLMSHYVRLDPDSRRSLHGLQYDGDLVSSLTNDVRVLREYVIHFYGGLPREGLQTVFLGATLVALSPKLFFMFLFGIVPAAVILRQFGKRLRGRTAKVLSETAELSEWIQQRLLGFETIKHFKTESTEHARLQQMNETLLARLIRAGRIRARTSPLIEAFGVTAIALILYVALVDVRSGSVTGAVLVSFFASIGLFAQTAAKLGKYFNSNREGSAAIDRIQSARLFFEKHARLDVTPEKGINLHDQGVIGCQSVTFRYPGQQIPAVDELSLSFSAGKIYGIAGPSGAGKSSLFRILLGLSYPESGHVWATSSAAYLPQSCQLMSGTLFENIVYPADSGDRSRAAEVLREVGLDGFVEQLDVPVGNFSGGQIQRVFLARLLYMDAKILLVDEGTSALDPEIEQVIYRSLRKMADSGACVVMIAHRMTALEHCDQVILMDQGKVCESGTCDDLRKSPRFQQLMRRSAQIHS